MLGLEPPGNIARDLALYRRSLFAGGGDASCLALPELAALAFADTQGAGERPARRELLRKLETAWNGIEGAFSTAGIAASRGLLYLELEGPYGNLASRATSALEELGFACIDSGPIEAGRGFYLCREPGSGSSAFAGAPRLSFKDCGLVLLRLSFASDPLAAASWRELARAKRRTGAGPEPSRRLPRRT